MIYLSFLGWKTKGRRGRELSAALTNENQEKIVNERALSIIISALGDNPLRAIQHCESAKEAWDKLESRYAGRTIMNKLGSLNTLLSMNLGTDTEMGDHVSLMESQFARLASMGSMIDEEMRVAILLTSIGNRPEYAPMMASINTLQDSVTTWNYVTVLLIEESKWIKKNGQHRTVNEALGHGTRAASIQREPVRCYRCNELGHMAQDCNVQNKPRATQNTRRP